MLTSTAPATATPGAKEPAPSISSLFFCPKLVTELAVKSAELAFSVTPFSVKASVVLVILLTPTLAATPAYLPTAPEPIDSVIVVVFFAVISKSVSDVTVEFSFT